MSRGRQPEVYVLAFSTFSCPTNELQSSHFSIYNLTFSTKKGVTRVREEKFPLPVDVRRSKTSVLKLPITSDETAVLVVCLPSFLFKDQRYPLFSCSIFPFLFFANGTGAFPPFFKSSFLLTLCLNVVVNIIDVFDYVMSLVWTRPYLAHINRSSTIHVNSVQSA